MSYLLAAEADKIQEFVFRSSRLREVTGASQVLARFCRDIPGELGIAPEQILVNDGGSFRFKFEDTAEARRYGAELTEVYAQALGSSLTVAEPVPWNGDFQAANKVADKALRQAKNRRQGVTSLVHLPEIAFCASCGTQIAVTYGQPKTVDEDRAYLCEACTTKSAEREDLRESRLLRPFLEHVAEEGVGADAYDFPVDADAVAEHDPRNYVAYLIADGNGMGEVFGRCNETQIRALSDGLTPAVRRSLAAPTQRLPDSLTLAYDGKGRYIVPVLPLILGGDDLFALLPAAYSLDMARSFCLAYEANLTHVLAEQVGLTDIKPTVSAAVVVCKSSYPYALAHRHGESLLKHAKRLAKRLAERTGERLSTLTFDVILGNELADAAEGDEPAPFLQPTLRPYWVVEPGKALSAEAQQMAIPIDLLLAQRRTLKDVPRKRLAQLRALFAQTPSEPREPEAQVLVRGWNAELEALLDRVGGSPETLLRHALTDLGQSKDATWGYWQTRREADRTIRVQGLGDLIEAWDFSLQLGHRRHEYEPGEAR